MQESSVLSSFSSIIFPLLLLLSTLPHPAPFSSSFFLSLLSFLFFSPILPLFLLNLTSSFPLLPPPSFSSSPSHSSSSLFYFFLPTLIDNFLFIPRNKYPRNTSAGILFMSLPASHWRVFYLEVLANLRGQCEFIVCLHIFSIPAKAKFQLPLSCQMGREKLISTQHFIDCSTPFGRLIFPFPPACHTSLVLPRVSSKRQCVHGQSVLSYWHPDDDIYLATGHRF